MVNGVNFNINFVVSFQIVKNIHNHLQISEVKKLTNGNYVLLLIKQQITMLTLFLGNELWESGTEHALIGISSAVLVSIRDFKNGPSIQNKSNANRQQKQKRNKFEMVHWVLFCCHFFYY